VPGKKGQNFSLSCRLAREKILVWALFEIIPSTANARTLPLPNIPYLLWPLRLPASDW
jgi:hypothetical protein